MIDKIMKEWTVMYTPTQRLMRSSTDKIIAGVAGGIAQYLAVDPVIVRIAFVALCFTGVGILLYPVLWLVMPLEGQLNAQTSQSARPDEDMHEVFVAPDSTTRRPRFDPMTGEPVDPENGPESDIPINNLNTGDATSNPQARRNRQLGLILLGVGAFILLSMIPGFGHMLAVAGRFLFPALLIIGGIILLRRNSVQ
jgi:phage shock protein C